MTEEHVEITRGPIKYMDPKEFQDLGFLQEANRKFFHPLGLALSVYTDETGTHLGDIWDYRDDPEGLVFSEETLSVDKVINVEQEYNRKQMTREVKLGFMVQPVWIRSKDGT